MSLSEDQRHQILTQALISFSEKSYHSVTMAEIAQQCGIDEATLKQHLASKPALLLTLVQSIEGDIDDILNEHAPQLECWQDVVDMLLVLARLYVEEELFSRYFTLIMFNIDHSTALQPVHDFLSKQEWDFIHDIAEVLEAERDKGSFTSSLDNGALAHTLYAAWEGVLTNAFYHRDLETVLPRVKVCLDLFYAGLQSGAAQDVPE